MSDKRGEVRAEIRNLREEQNRLRNLKDGFPSEVEKILYQEAWRVLGGKSIPIAPIDTGRLRASARVDMPEREGDRISVRLSYNTDYAKYVHERTDGSGGPVNYKAPNTQSLFLINPLIENIDEMSERMSKRLDQWVKQNAG